MSSTPSRSAQPTRVSPQEWAEAVLAGLQGRHPHWCIVGSAGGWWAWRGSREVIASDPYTLEQYICEHDAQDAAEEQQRLAAEPARPFSDHIDPDAPQTAPPSSFPTPDARQSAHGWSRPTTGRGSS